MTNYELIGNNIKQYRLLKQLTQKQLGKLINRTESTIQKYEAGKVDIPLSTLKRISEELSCTPTQLGIYEDFANPSKNPYNDIFIQYINSLNHEILEIENGFNIYDASGNIIYITNQELSSLKFQIDNYTKFTVDNLLAQKKVK